MPFPSLSGSNPITLAAGLQQAMGYATDLKNRANALIALCQAGPVGADQFLPVPAYFTRVNNQLTAIAAISGMGAYAQAQIGSASENIPNDFTAFQTAITNVVNWITTNFPKDANSNLLCMQFGSGGALTYTQFTVAQLAGLVTVLQALVAAIN